MNYTEEQIKKIVRKVISEMSNVPLKNLSIMQKNELASNPNTSPETLTLLADDEDSVVRFWVAKNPNTSPETLDRLANDENYLVRRAVATNPKALPETLDRLANDKNWSVRRAVATNPKALPETLDLLANDKDIDVRSSATNNPNYNKKITVTLTLTQKQLAELQKSGSYSFKLS
jgi:hypothetical protein